MKNILSVITLLVLTCGSSASAEIFVDLGNHVLNPNQAGQMIDIRLTRTGSEVITATNAFFGIQGTGELPSFNIVSNADDNGTISEGAIFEGIGFVFDGLNTANNEIPPGSNPRDQTASFLLFDNDFANEVAADGILVRLEVDTTGVDAGNFTLVDLNQDTTFFDLNDEEVAKAVTSDGSIRIAAVPEPSSIFFVSVAFGLAGLRRRRFTE